MPHHLVGVKMSRELHRAARLLAAQRDSNLSLIVRELLKSEIAAAVERGEFELPTIHQPEEPIAV
jgi:hypothetical protein